MVIRWAFVTFEKTISSNIQGMDPQLMTRGKRISIGKKNDKISVDKYLGVFDREEKTWVSSKTF